MHYFDFHIGDWQASCSHMNALEQGVYLNLLLVHYSIGEKGLPNDDNMLFRYSKCATKRQWNSVKSIVLSKFTEDEKGNLVNETCLAKHKSYVNKANEARAKALKRWETTNATALPQQCQGNANHKPITNNQKNTKKDYSPEFDLFWSNYPRKTDKKKSFKSYTAAIKRSTPEELLAGVQNYTKYCELHNTDTQYIKHATTWLNNDCWLEQYNLQAKPSSTTQSVTDEQYKKNMYMF